MHHYVVVTDIDTPAALLREARNQLFERPWAQGTIHRPTDGGVCAEGACLAAAGRVEELLNGDASPLNIDIHGINPLTLAAQYLVRAIPVERGETTSGYIGWIHVYNDDRGRTFPEIIDWFDRAEKLAETDAAS